jgi:hypothetical protein
LPLRNYYIEHKNTPNFNHTHIPKESNLPNKLETGNTEMSGRKKVGHRVFQFQQATFSVYITLYDKNVKNSDAFNYKKKLKIIVQASTCINKYGLIHNY